MQNQTPIKTPEFNAKVFTEWWLKTPHEERTPYDAAKWAHERFLLTVSTNNETPNKTHQNGEETNK
jgi:hypothetical protein